MISEYVFKKARFSEHILVSEGLVPLFQSKGCSCYCLALFLNPSTSCPELQLVVLKKMLTGQNLQF